MASAPRGACHPIGRPSLRQGARTARRRARDAALLVGRARLGPAYQCHEGETIFVSGRERHRWVQRRWKVPSVQRRGHTVARAARWPAEHRADPH